MNTAAAAARPPETGDIRPVQTPPRVAWRIEALWCVATMVVSLLAAAFAVQLWSAHLHVPLGGTQGDIVFNMMVVKDAIGSGWIQVNDQLGAPFGQHLLDFPVLSGDNLQYLAIKSFGLVSDDVAAVTNIFYLLTFPAAAGSAFLVLRALGVSRWAAAACGVLFAVLPYHFLRSEQHLLLSAYEAVPLGAFFVLSVLMGRSRWRRREGVSGWKSWLSATTLISLACGIVIGSASVYYATFTVVLLVIVTPLAALAARDRRPLFEGAALIVLVVAVMGVNLAPNLAYTAVHGADPLIAKRVPQESEIYSLNLAQLVMPTSSHRLKPLADLKYRYASTTLVPSEGSASLGTVGTIGLVVGLILVLVVALRGRAPTGRWRLARAGGMAGLITMLVGTTGGVSSLIAYLLTPQVRGWNRISVFIGFFALVVVAVLLDALRERLVLRRRGAILAPAAIAAIVVLGVLDQTSPAFVPNYSGANGEWSNDARFVRAIEQRLPGNAEIFQLPYVPFPENPPLNGMLDYDLARGYLHTSRLRFSYGAMKGRDADWSAALAEAPPGDVLESVVAAGFQGLWIDRAAYKDQALQLEQEVRRVSGQQPLVSENGRLAFYDLRPLAGALRQRAGAPAFEALGRATLDPVALGWVSGFYGPETSGGSNWRWMSGKGAVSLTNPDDHARDAVVSARLVSGRPGNLVVRWPDGSEQRLRTGSRAVELRRTIRLAPGTSQVTLTTDSLGPPQRAAGDTRDVRLQVVDPVVTDPAAAPALLTR